MMNYINQTADKHIVTLEDPIGVGTRIQSIINQREIGIDCPSCTAAPATAALKVEGVFRCPRYSFSIRLLVKRFRGTF